MKDKWLELRKKILIGLMKLEKLYVTQYKEYKNGLSNKAHAMRSTPENRDHPRLISWTPHVLKARAICQL